MSEQDLSRKFELQVTKCDARWQAIETSLRETNESLSEILHLLRGEGTDSGLVGKVEANRQRIEGMSRIFKAVWVLLSGTIVAVISSFFKQR